MKYYLCNEINKSQITVQKIVKKKKDVLYKKNH